MVKIKYFNYIQANIHISLTKIKEYKINTISAIIVQIFFYITRILFLGVFASNFGEVINWSIKDFMLYFILVNFIIVFSSIIIYHPLLKNNILKGQLNVYLIRPINRFFCYNFHNLSGVGFNMSIFNIVASIFIINYYNIELTFSITAPALIILLILLYITIKVFVESINFWSLGLSQTAYKLVSTADKTLEVNPGKLFENVHSNFLYTIPLFLVATLLMPTLKGEFTSPHSIQITILISTICILAILTAINWHFGLKKYEAFG